LILTYTSQSFSVRASLELLKNDLYFSSIHLHCHSWVQCFFYGGHSNKHPVSWLSRA
jgi:hypothetical protein